MENQITQMHARLDALKKTQAPKPSDRTNPSTPDFLAKFTPLA
jgi:hypothetical protein